MRMIAKAKLVFFLQQIFVVYVRSVVRNVQGLYYIVEYRRQLYKLKFSRNRQSTNIWLEYCCFNYITYKTYFRYLCLLTSMNTCQHGECASITRRSITAVPLLTNEAFIWRCRAIDAKIEKKTMYSQYNLMWSLSTLNMTKAAKVHGNTTYTTF